MNNDESLLQESFKSKSQKRSSLSFENLNFNCLSMASLQNYSKKYQITIPETATHTEAVEIVKRHFMTLYVDEEQVIQSFIKRVDEISKHSDIISSQPTLGERRPRKPKKYGDDFSLPKMVEDDLRKDEDYPDQDVEDNRQYCICNKPSNDNMVACDNENCKIKWFHYECVNFDPKKEYDKWYCPICLQQMSTNLIVC